MVVHLVVFCTIQKLSNKAQKIRGILNVFGGAYDHTNNQRCEHGYRKKTVFRFIDRIVDQKNNSTVKQIFLVLDNISIHKSNKVK